MKKLIHKILFYGQRFIKSYITRNLVRKIQISIKGKLSITGTSKLILKENEKNFTDQLIKNGFVELDKQIDFTILESIYNFSKKLLLFDPFNQNLGDFTDETIPEKTHVANFLRKDLVQCDEILKIANDPGVLRVVQEFLGGKPTISNINMWWSIAGKSQAKDAQLFHRDVDDIKFCKLFIYLTDVGLNDGPHTYVKGSSSTNKLTKIRRYQDEEIIAAFGEENILYFDRPKGSCFIVDTYGFHKGTLPKDNDRLLLQVQYSINPIGIENYNPTEIKHTYDKYINRLILK
jgi:hypothetical protein